MNIEYFRELCLSLYLAKENTPWSEPEYEDLVTYTVADKWFCLLNLDEKRCNLKCAPDQVVDLQDRYDGVESAWHMNKKHWIGLHLDSDVPDSEIVNLVNQAYGLVVNSLTKKKRLELGLL